MKIAVVGAGISGITCAYLLCGKYKDVHIFEKEVRPGGGIYSIKFSESGKEHFIDLGFTLYNRKHYPNLVRLLDRLDIHSQETFKEICINYQSGRMGWSLGDNSIFFPKISSYFKPFNYKVLAGWLKIKRHADEFLEKRDMDKPLREHLDEIGVQKDIVKFFVKPLVEGLWTSIEKSEFEYYPAYYFYGLLRHLGLFEKSEQSKWRIVRGGSFRIISQMVSALINPIKYQTEVVNVVRNPNYVEVYTNKGEKEVFDAVVIAIPGIDALKILEKPSPSEELILGSFTYGECYVILHTDERFAVSKLFNERAWIIQVSEDDKSSPIVTWNLNRVQQLSLNTRLFLTFTTNPHLIPSDKVIHIIKRRFIKPTWKMLITQRRFGEINGVNRTYFCGDYWGWGTLEDSLSSALKVAQYFFKEQINF
ncbi:MAG: FAD-dependent oxidoreductase [Candidatus Hydrogenedentes bacterium]|nr:FAD-dependent oxidoreductase [Candidatus Hydrogenedentota bacterium]